ncbi:hypothetical protein GW7_03660 [Heterocephalus glaber]|uniref:Uncharacterized protein n=1 Tax=Heterocephalus glaber TaxID=10181 RepID=G5B1J9_HETGA|nr:hypothetical protein GW7_03660 [Heterocephalus glaber]
MVQGGEESVMSWFQKQLVWNTNHYGSGRGSQGLQMPIGIPIALGVLALLTLLALACNCLKEVPDAHNPMPPVPPPCWLLTLLTQPSVLPGLEIQVEALLPEMVAPSPWK